MLLKECPVAETADYGEYDRTYEDEQRDPIALFGQIGSADRGGQYRWDPCDGGDSKSPIGQILITGVVV